MDAKELLPNDIEFDEPSDPQMEAVADIEEAAQRLDLEAWIVNKLRHCERELTVNIPLVRDDGSATTFTGFRMQHVSWRGPSAGVVSFSPNTHLSAVRANAMSATWQSALLDVHFGGASGAIVCDPAFLSERELRHLSREYIYGLRGMLGRHADILLPGTACNDQIMSWMLDAHVQTLGRMERGTITGLPAALSGVPIADPVGRGVLAILRYMLASRRTTPSHDTNDSPHHLLAGKRVSIQGFGSIGSSIARVLHQAGARIAAVADVSGAIRNHAGIDIPALQEHVATTGVVFGFPAAEPCRNLDVLESDCDVLITAAAERQMTAAIARNTRASIVMEATRSAVTHGAESALSAQDVIVVPEVLTTAGGLVAAFLEWQQSDQISPPSAAEVDHELDRRITGACRAVFACADSQRLTLRGAAHLLALERIAAEMRLRK